MWLSRKLSQHEMQDVASAQDGTVTVEGGELAVFSSGEKREVKTAAPGGYEWRPRKGENVLVVRLFGELDHHAAAGIREDIDRSLERCAPCDLVFDFEKVTYMDSAGIGMVLGRYRRLREAGGSVVIASCAKTVRGILHMAGIFSLMPYAQTREEAVKLLKEKEAAEWKEF